MQDAFRKGMGNAMLWFDSLIGHVDDLVQSSVQLAEDATRNALQDPRSNGGMVTAETNQLHTSTTVNSAIPAALVAVATERPEPGVKASGAPPKPSSGGPQLPTFHCDRLLRRLCPLCFGGIKYGTPVSEYVPLANSDISVRY
jgi:hypothetical protein